MFLFLTPESNNKVAGLQMSPNVKSHDDTKHSPRFHVTTPNNNKISIILFRPSKLIPMKPNNEWLKNLLNILVVAGSIMQFRKIFRGMLFIVAAFLWSCSGNTDTTEVVIIYETKQRMAQKSAEYTGCCRQHIHYHYHLHRTVVLPAHTQ